MKGGSPFGILFSHTRCPAIFFQPGIGPVLPGCTDSSFISGRRRYKHPRRKDHGYLWKHDPSICLRLYAFAERCRRSLQDTLIQFLRTAPAFESPAHEKAWLLRVTANLSKNRLGYNRRRQTDELNDELIGEEREDLSFVWEAVKSLPPGQREAIHLFYYEGYSTGEIAHILNRREATVRSDLFRARAKLRDILKEAYDFEQ